MTYLLPFTTPYVMWLVDNVGFIIDTIRVDISYRIFNDYFDLPIHQEGEVIVHYNDSVRAVEAIRDIVVENKLPVNYITEVCNHGSYYHSWLTVINNGQSFECFIRVFKPSREK